MPVLFLALVLLQPPPAGIEHKTQHFDLYSEVGNERDTGQLLEALHTHLTRHFGKAPAKRLRVLVYADRERFRKALVTDGAKTNSTGGFYSFRTKKVYICRQPSHYYQRQLLLHESTHQFHHHVAGTDAALKVSWYTEGLAEYFGMHNWDGKTLQCGVVPALTLEEYPTQALAALAQTERNFTGIVMGRTKTDYATAWALVHFFQNRQPARFRKLAARLDRGEDAAAAWKAEFADVSVDGLVKDFRQWLEKHPQPWKIVWTGWQQWGDALEGTAPQVNALTVLRQAPSRFAVALERTQGLGPCGIVFGFQSETNFYLLQLWGDKQLRLIRYQDRKWSPGKFLALPPRQQGRTELAVTIAAGRVTLLANGVSLETLDAPGQVGLNVDSCTARFWLVK